MQIVPSEEPDPENSQYVFYTRLNSHSFIRKTFEGIKKLLSFGRKTSSLEDEVQELIEEHDPEGTQVGSEERSILHNVFSLSEKCVSDLMVPRADIVAVEYKITLDELKNLIVDNEHTRIPVYKGSLDNVVGFIHIKDLVKYLGSSFKNNFSIQSVLREALFVPPSMKVIDLLLRMQAKRVHLALVLDEYGGTDGLVTMEDLVEEIIGEIEDEHDKSGNDTHIKDVDSLSFEVNARMPVAELEKKLSMELVGEDESEDFHTLGGLIFYMLGHVPMKGEIIKHKAGVEFEVLEAGPRKVSSLLVRRVAHK